MATLRSQRQFIANQTKKYRREGFPPPQAVAIAYSKARKKGYDVPAPIHIPSRERTLSMLGAKPVKISYGRHGKGYRYKTKVGGRTITATTKGELKSFLESRGYRVK